MAACRRPAPVRAGAGSAPRARHWGKRQSSRPVVPACRVRVRRPRRGPPWRASPVPASARRYPRPPPVSDPAAECLLPQQCGAARSGQPENSVRRLCSGASGGPPAGRAARPYLSGLSPHVSSPPPSPSLLKPETEIRVGLSLCSLPTSIYALPAPASLIATPVAAVIETAGLECASESQAQDKQDNARDDGDERQHEEQDEQRDADSYSQHGQQDACHNQQRLNQQQGSHDEQSDENAA